MTNTNGYRQITARITNKVHGVLTTDTGMKVNAMGIPYRFHQGDVVTCWIRYSTMTDSYEVTSNSMRLKKLQALYV